MNFRKQLCLFLPLLLAGMLLCLPSVAAQDPFYINYKTQDGLPSLMVYSVFQDSKGYIWISTDLGVSRFDGQSFQNFSYQDGLSDNEVFNFFEDSKGRIWVYTFNGRACYFYNNKFHNQQNNTTLKNASQDQYISSITEDSKGNIYIGSNSLTGKKIDLNNNVSSFQNPDSSSNINFIWINQEDELRIGHQMGISKLENNETIRLIAYEAGLTRGHARGTENSTHVFLGVKKHLFVYEKASEQIIASSEIDLIDTEIISLRFIDDYLWAGTRNGIIKLGFEDESFLKYSTQKLLEGYSVSSVYSDKENNLWFSTLEAGVFFSPIPESLHLNKKNGLPENQVYCISESADGRLWLGSAKNTYSILHDGQFESFKIKGHADLEITDIKHFSEEEYWILGKGLSMKATPEGEQYLFVHTNDLIKDQYNQIWFGHSRLMRFSEQHMQQVLINGNDSEFTEKMKTPIVEIVTLNPIDKKMFSCYARDKKNRIWAGSTRGLFWYEYDEQQVIDQNREELIEANVTDLLFDNSRDVLWVATSINGLWLIQNDTVVRSFNKAEGLTSNMITCLVFDSKGHLWIGSDKGVDKLFWDGSNYQIENFTTRQGLYNMKINDLFLDQEKIYLATESGLIILPLKIPHQQSKPPVYITAFKVNGEEIDFNKKKTYHYKENSMEFEFTGLSYRNQQSLRYQYRLIGEEDEWTTSKTNSIQYKSLWPGEYTFEVKAQNAMLQESERIASIQFKIEAPFWQTGWFILSASILLFSFIFLMLKLRIRRLKKQHQLEQRLVYAENDKLEIERDFLDLEMRALRLQMNPHFMFNALNTIKGYYAQDKVREANAYISKFAQLLRLILKNNDKFISLEKEVNILNYYMLLTQIRYENVFDFDITVDEILDQQDIAIPPMLLQPMVENAIIHGLAPRRKKGLIKISFEVKDGILISKVRDNGIGRKASAKISKHKVYKSKATEITQERLAIINKDYQIVNYFQIRDLQNSDGSAEGTEVTIKTPLKTIWT